ncbi:MAG: InlB B-repeat-containing protein [Bacteroidaceae bacterium]|nr:InlB B-repeat-containing protein [Bacteroidaceae bacterium]
MKNRSFDRDSARRWGLWLVALLTLGQAWALTVTMSPQGAGTYEVVGRKLYVTANPGYYLLEARLGNGITALTEEADENGVFFTVSDSWEVTIYFGTYTNNVHVTFNMNGHGGTAPAAQDLTLGDKVTCPSPDPADESLTFCGWATDRRGWEPYDFNTVLTNSLPYSIPKKYYTLTLYAVWADTSKEYTLSYYDDNLETTDSIQGGSLYKILDENVFYHDPIYRLVGWATEPGGSAIFTPGQTIIVTEDLTLYAVWGLKDAEYDIGPDEFNLTKAGYTDITCTMEKLVLGIAGYDDHGEPILADGIFISMFSDKLVGRGYRIPLKLADADHTNPDNTKYFYCTKPGDTFTLAVYIDPEDIKTAPPGDYLGVITCISNWSPTDNYPPEELIFIGIVLPKRGDVNGDGVVNVTDVTALVNIILGNNTDYNTLNADVNLDGVVNVTDVTALVNIILGQ